MCRYFEIVMHLKRSTFYNLELQTTFFLFAFFLILKTLSFEPKYDTVHTKYDTELILYDNSDVED